MSVTAADRASVDEEVREALLVAGARVTDVVELPPLVDLLGAPASEAFAGARRYREGGVRSDLDGSPSLRYEYAGPAGLPHSCRVYLPTRRVAVSSLNLGTTLHTPLLTPALAQATRDERERAREVSRLHERGFATSEAADRAEARLAATASRLTSNATALRLARAVEGSGRAVVAALVPTPGFEDLVEAVRALGVEHALAGALAEALRGAELPERRSSEVSDLLEEVASGVPVEWALRRLAVEVAS